MVLFQLVYISKKIVIVGDSNVDFLNIPHTHPVNEILTSQFLENKISEPTRVTQSTSTLIDPILATNEVSVFDSGTLGVDQNISDHLCTYISVKTNVCYNGAYERKVWLYKNADFDKLNLLITNTDWNELILGACDIDRAAENFSNTFLTLFKECIPEKSVVIRPKDKPWFDSALRKEIRIRNRLRKIALKSNKAEDIKKYKKSRNKIDNMKNMLLKITIIV